jgi:hypothetical protein
MGREDMKKEERDKGTEVIRKGRKGIRDEDCK